MEVNTELQNKMKVRFYANLFNQDSKYNSVLLTKEKYDSIIEDVKRIKLSKKKESSRDYRIIERYDVLIVQGCENLIEPLSDTQKNIKKFVHADELFDILYSTHLSVGHRGRDRMLKELNILYKNITQAQIKLFLNLCEPCQQKQKSEKKGIVVKPINSSHFNNRCQVDLIDYQSQPDGMFKFLLVYQDHLTKFLILRPLTSNRADEVAYQLLDIFLLLGAPCILHSDNDHEFCNRVLDSVHKMWPELKMVHGKPRPTQNQGSVEQASQDIEHMLTTWMADNQTTKWSEVVRFVQFMKNRAYHSEIKRSPYEAMFGSPAKVGLTSSIIPQEILHSLHNEEDLDKFLEDSEKNMSKNTPSTKEPLIQNAAIDEFQLSSTSVPVQIHQEVVAEALVDTREQSQSQLIEDPVIKDAQLSHTDKKSLSEEIFTKDVELSSISKVAPSQNQQERELLMCIVCFKETSGAHTCFECNLFIHAICGETESREEGYGKKILCTICRNNMDQKRQCEKAKERLDVNHPVADEGTTVRIKVVNSSKTNTRSILAVVLSKTDEGFYKLGTKKGILKQLYASSQFSVCQERFLTKEDVPDVEISLQQTANGKDFRKCDSKSKCSTNRCACRKNKFLCNSKCHQSLDCTNK